MIPKLVNLNMFQFSDHNISPVKTSHFHIFHGGESQEKVLSELENWPTYYPKMLTGFEIAQRNDCTLVTCNIKIINVVKS